MKRRSEAAEQPSTGPWAGVGGGSGSPLAPACAAVAAAALKWACLPQPTAESSAESGACLSDAALREAGPEGPRPGPKGSAPPSAEVAARAAQLGGPTSMVRDLRPAGLARPLPPLVLVAAGAAAAAAAAAAEAEEEAPEEAPEEHAEEAPEPAAALEPAAAPEAPELVSLSTANS